MAPENLVKWIRAGWLIDGSGAPAAEGVFMAIRRGVIERIATAIPLDTSFEDLSSATVIPALMDAHVHLAFSGSMKRRIRTAQLKHDAAAADQAVRRHLADQWRHGVVAVRDGGDRLGAALNGKTGDQPTATIGVTVKACGWAWHAEGRYGRMLGRAVSSEKEVAEQLSPCMAAVDHLKVIQSGLNSIDRLGHSGPPQFDEAALNAMVSVARRAERPVMVHANGERAVRLALEAGCSSIEHGYFMGDENLMRMADRAVCWVPTVVPMAALIGAPHLTAAQIDVVRRSVDHQLNQIQKAMVLGVPIVLGTDAGSQGVDHGAAVRQELSHLTTAGMQIERAVQCATGRAACLLGLPRRGELRPGCRADFLVVNADPERLGKGLAGAPSLWVNGRRRR